MRPGEAQQRLQVGNTEKSPGSRHACAAAGQILKRERREGQIQVARQTAA
jgi:hypothetical protein